MKTHTVGLSVFGSGRTLAFAAVICLLLGAADAPADSGDEGDDHGRFCSRSAHTPFADAVTIASGLMKVVRLCTLYLISLIASLCMAALSPTGARAAPARSADVESIAVRWADGLLSVKAHDIALVELLDEIAREASFSVVSCVTLGQRVSVEFNQRPLADALSTVLSNQNFVLSWKYVTPSPRKRMSRSVRPETLWILQHREESYSDESGAIERAAIDAEVSRLQSALSYGTTEDQEQAAIELGRWGHAGAVYPLSRALADGGVKAEVRQAVIESLVEIGGADSARAVAVALSDADPRIREEAVNALGDIGEATAIALLQQALWDEIAFVRQAAADALDQLRGTAP